MERPSQEELESLYEEYGKPEVKEEEVQLTSLEYKGDYPECKGEAIIEIIEDDKLVGVRHQNGEEFVLPMGRVWESEDFSEGVKREAKEETGLDIELESLEEIRKVRFSFSNEKLERWQLLFRAYVLEGDLKPEDEEEIAEAKLIDGDYYWEKGFYTLRKNKRE